jgi:hypothetical protein
MRVAAVVVERRAGRPRHRPVKDVLYPVRATLHLYERHRHGVGQRLAPFKAGSLVQQVLDRNGLLAIVGIDDRPVGKEIQRAAIKAVEQSVFQRDGDQRGGDGLGRRIDAVLMSGPERRVIRLGDDPAVPRDKKAFHFLRRAEIHQIGERMRVHPLQLRRRRFPCLRRPDHVVLGGCGGAADGRHERRYAERNPQDGRSLVVH